MTRNRTVKIAAVLDDLSQGLPLGFRHQRWFLQFEGFRRLSGKKSRS